MERPIRTLNVINHLPTYYDVRVDPNKVSLLLNEYGVPNEELGNINMLLSPEIHMHPRGPRLYGSASKRGMVLYPITCQLGGEDVNDIFLHEAKHIIDAHNPIDSIADQRYSVILRKTLRGILVATAISAAAMSSEDGNMGLIALGTGVFTGMLTKMMGDQFHPRERRANRFANQLKKDPRWNDIVSVTYQH